MTLTRDYIKVVVQDFFKDKPVKRVYLFGSYAIDQANEDSDVDLLVDLDYDKKIGFEFFRWYEDLEKILSRKVDVVSENSLRKDRLITKFIQEQKVLLYARSD